jgi:hypothetical protein
MQTARLGAAGSWRCFFVHCGAGPRPSIIICVLFQGRLTRETVVRKSQSTTFDEYPALNQTRWTMATNEANMKMTTVVKRKRA